MDISVDVNAIAVSGELLPNKIKGSMIKGVTLNVGKDKMPNTRKIEIKAVEPKIEEKVQETKAVLKEEDEPII